MSFIPSRLVRRFERDSITNEDLNDISNLIISEIKLNGEINSSDISTLLSLLNKSILGLDWKKKNRKRHRLIKKIFKLITINDHNTFPFPLIVRDFHSLSIAIKCSSSDRAKKDFLEYISSNNHDNDFIHHFSNTIANLSEKEIENVVKTLIRSIRRNYKTSLWNLYIFLKKVNHTLAPFFNDLLYALRDSLKQESSFAWEESKAYPNARSKKGLLSLTCIQQLISTNSQEVNLTRIATELLANLSGTVWDKSADLAIINLLTRRTNHAEKDEIANFLNKVHSTFSVTSSLSTYSIDLIGSLLNIYLDNEKYNTECKRLLDLFFKNITDFLAGKSFSLSSAYALSTIPVKYVEDSLYNKITNWISQISAKPSYYLYEIMVKGNNKILRDYAFDKNELERFNPVKLICSSISKSQSLFEKVFEIRLATTILKSIKRPEDLSFFKQWDGKHDALRVYELIESILDGAKKVEVNIITPNEPNSSINLQDVFLLDGELSFKGMRDLFEFEKTSFIASIRYWMPQIARAFALQLLWEKGLYINLNEQNITLSNSSIKFIDRIVNEIIELFPSADFLNLCKILESFANCKQIILDKPEVTQMGIKYCESEHSLENPFIRFILSSLPLSQTIFDNVFKAISNLSTLTDDDVALFLADDNDIFIARGIYMDKSTITGEKKARMLKEQREIRECIRNELLKVEKYFYLIGNTISTQAIDHNMIELLLKLLKQSLVILLTRKCSTTLLTKLVQAVLSNEDVKSLKSSGNTIVSCYLAIYSISDNDVIPKSIDKLLGLISNKRLSRPLASLILPIPLERLKMIDVEYLNQSEDGANALSVLSYQLKQRLDLPVPNILSTLCQIISKSGNSPNKVMIDSIVELAYYTLDEECISIITDFILSPSQHLRFALSQMISKRRDFLQDLYKFLKVLVFDSGPASIPAKNVTVFYRQSGKISSLDPTTILDIKYDKQLEDIMPEMIGRALATTYFEKDCSFSELVLIISARYVSSSHETRLAILYTIIHLFKGNKNQTYNPFDIELILKFLSTVVLQQARTTIMDEIQMSTNTVTIIEKALTALEMLVLSDSTELKPLQEIVDRLSTATADSSGISASIITRCCNLLRLLIMIKARSTMAKVSVQELVHNFLDDRYEMEDIWFMFFSKTFVGISKFEDKRILLNLFNICFERMNKLSRGEKIEFVIRKSTILAASFSLNINRKDLPIDKIIEYISTGSRHEALRSLNYITNLFRVDQSGALTLFDFKSRSNIINALFSLISDPFLPIKQSAIELTGVLGQHDSEKLFDTVSEVVLSEESSNKKRLGAIKFATTLIRSAPSLVESYFDIEFLVEASLDSDSQVRSAAIECVNCYVESLLKSIKISSFPLNEFKKALLSPIDVNLQTFLEAIETNYNIPFSIILPILKRSLRSRTHQVRILTLKYLKSYELPSIDSLVFHPLVELDEEEAQLVGEVLSRVSMPEDLLTSFKQSAIAKSSPHERFCYSRVLALISNYKDLEEWSYNILRTSSPYYKLHGILSLFINFNPVVFSNQLDSIIDTISKLLNHENDIVREASLDLFKHLIESYPDRTSLFIKRIDSIFCDFSPKAAPSRDYATQLIPILIDPADEKNKEILFVNAYLAKYDVSNAVTQRAEQVWRNIASNSRRVLFKILPRLLDKLSVLNSTTVIDSCIESIISLERDVVPGSYTIINPMIDYILENKYIYILKSIISVSNKVMLQDRMDLICQFLKNSCLGPDSSVSIQALGLISKWVKSVMDDSLIFLIEESLYNSTCPSFKTLKSLNTTPDKLLSAWKLVKIRDVEELDGFWDVANLLLSLSNQNLPELSKYLSEILTIRNPSRLISIPPVALFWEFGIRGPEVLVKESSMSKIAFESVVKSLIEYAPSKTLTIEFAPSIIDTAISNVEVLHSLFTCSDLPSHQGILIILAGYTLANNESLTYSKADLSRCVIPSILSYLTNLTATNPSSLGLSFNSQVAYSISYLLKIFAYEFLNHSELRLCGLLIRAAGDWSNLLYKASLLSSLYHLVNSVINSPRGAALLRPLAPQLLGLSIKSLDSPVEKEKTPMPFNPSYPTFSIQNDPCNNFPAPLVDGYEKSVLLSPITYVSYSALSLFQTLIPFCLDRSELVFNELFKVLTPSSSQYLFMAMEYIVGLGNFSEQITKFKSLFKNTEERICGFYTRVIVAHAIKNDLKQIDNAVEEISANPPAFESGLLLATLEPSLILPFKDRLLEIYKYYIGFKDSSPTLITHSRNIAISLFEKILDESFGNLPLEFLKAKPDLNSNQLKQYLKIVEELVSRYKTSVLNDYEAIYALIRLLSTAVSESSSTKQQVDLIVTKLGDSKQLVKSLSHFSQKEAATLNAELSKLRG